MARREFHGRVVGVTGAPRGLGRGPPARSAAPRARGGPPRAVQPGREGSAARAAGDRRQRPEQRRLDERRGAHEAEHVQAGGAAHLQVGDQQVVALVGQSLDGLLAVAERLHEIAALLERRLQAVAHDRLIVEDQELARSRGREGRILRQEPPR